ncbi:MAG: MFS transporter [Coxiellaceae bacterium]|nr:MFS transporter [Coxiellaceae bacterium]
MPRGIPCIFLLQIFSTMSFAVMYATLVLYMKQKIGLTGKEADSITGVYFAYNFALHLFAGFIAGRFFTYRALIAVGVFFQLIAALFLSQQTLLTLYIGMAAMLVGTGTMVTCINMLVSQLFSPTDSRRETAFLWNYSGMNIGFLLGNSLAGFFQVSGDYHTLYLLTAASNVVTLVVLFINWRCLHDRGSILAKVRRGELYKRQMIGFGIVCILVPVLYVLLQYPSLSGGLILFGAAAMIVYIVKLAFNHEKPVRNKILVFLVLLIAAQIFWIIYQLTPMGLTLFAQDNVDRHVMGYLVTQGWISDINNITIIFGGPLLAVFFRWYRNRSSVNILPIQYGLGLTLSSAGLLILPIGIAFANQAGLVDFSWLFSTYVLLALAELLISPIGYSMVGRLIPSNMQSMMMGMVLFNSGVAAVLASFFSNQALGDVETSNPLVSNPSFAHVFHGLGWSALACAVIIFALTPILRRMMSSS